MPNAIYEPATCIRTTLAAAKKHNFPAERLLSLRSQRQKTPLTKWMRTLCAKP